MASNSIHKWRLLQHAGDGCAVYQCLCCHQLWESPTEPGWIDIAGNYQRIWNFCPHCGIEWEGQANIDDGFRPRELTGEPGTIR